MAFSKNSELLGKGVNNTASLSTDIFNWISLFGIPPLPYIPLFKKLLWY